MRLGAKEFRTLSESEGEKIMKKIRRNEIYLILDDIIDTYNVGGFFRLAEAIAVKKVYLCGRTETPPNPKIVKSSVGTYKVVPWEYKKSALDAVEEIRKITGVKIFAVELDEKSVDYRKADYSFPMAFIFGNEMYGMDEETMKLADQVVEIPMYGVNTSLNAMVSAGIVLYEALHQAKEK